MIGMIGDVTVGDVWENKHTHTLTTVQEIKKRGRGYYLVIDSGRIRLKDFLKDYTFNGGAA